MRISSEEELDVKKMKAGIPDGKREVSILFEEIFDLIFYLGVIGMALSLIFGVIVCIIQVISGKKLKEKLDKEYGNPEKYNRESR